MTAAAAPEGAASGAAPAGGPTSAGDGADGAAPLRPELEAGLLLGALGALGAALPASARAGFAPLPALALLGGAVLWVAPLAAVLRAARPWPRSWLAAPVAVGLAAPALVVLARLLKAATHHRPLGAATFALLGLGVVLGALAVSARVHRAGASPWPRRALAALGALGAAGVALGALRALGAPAVDGLLVALAVIGAVRLPVPRALPRRAGLPLVALLLALGLVGMALAGGDRVLAASPLLGWPASAF